MYHDTALKSLDLTSNCISIQGLQEIVSILYSNSTLLLVDIRNNTDKIPISFIKVILKKLKSNLKKHRVKRNYDGDWEQKIANIQSSIGPILLASEPASPMTPVFRERVAYNHTFEGSHENTYEESKEDFTETESSFVPPRIGLGYDHTPLHDIHKKRPENCEKCKDFERALFKSESNCVALTLKLKALENKLERSGSKNRLTDRSLENMRYPQAKNSKSLRNFIQDPSETRSLSSNEADTLEKIENQMQDLTRLMDYFEQKNTGKSKHLFR